jgi:MFS family permease
LVTTQWHLSTAQTSWVTGAAVLGAFVGAFTFGREADLVGRKVVYVAVAVIMVLGALASALATGFTGLLIAKLVLGLGIGGDYRFRPCSRASTPTARTGAIWLAWSFPCRRPGSK